MDIKDLNSGDLLLFSPEKGSWISDAIVWLTGAPVSHAAMSYKDFSNIIEETPPAVRVAPASERFKERTIHVMRDQRHSEFSPVIKAASHYLNELEPYGMSNLYLVGLILVYKKLTPSGMRQKAILRILKLAVEKLLPIINHYKYGDKTPMVCSQFVFQCYQDAGADYELTIKNGNLLKAANQNQDNLLARAANHQTPAQSKVQVLGAAPDILPTEVNGEELLAQLKSDDGDFSSDLENQILDTVHHFAQAIHAIEQKIEFDNADSKQGIVLLQQQQAMFVTPADLLEHCPDLSKMGEIKI
ncbi:hypothetical protein [Kangiella sp. TOML190]|uniref:hypothetical protein n=1 Tax=Kangiella sp. TOML190 TaxID=2931351 RepID=UPI00203FF2FE|nr:hypothetical protein [Kangiella sp. TOML190]